MTSDRMLSLVRAAWPEAIAILDRPWETPTRQSAAISALLPSFIYWSEVRPEVTVIGSPEQHILCLIGDDQVVFCVSHDQLIDHPFLHELREEFDVRFEGYPLLPYGHCLIAPLSQELRNRLKIPSVLLVSLFHAEMYPAVRLTLGIAYLASYLRLRHLAHVELMDCQLGPTVDDVLKNVRQRRPDILGVSVNFGQFDLMEQLLNGIYGSTAEGEAPVVILGNILPAMCFREILEAYPQVVICRKEGEMALASLIKCGRDRTRWSQVPGIYYLNKQRQLVSTPPSYLPLAHLPPPALDTLPEIFARDGVITAEFSRGCQYNQCSFCPRSHKGSVWRTVPVTSMLQQWEIFARVFQHFQRTPHVFLADEDFVGKEEGETTIQRITNFLDGVRATDLSITFDASCRADQIFRDDRDHAWHISRGQLFNRCREGGLSRLFLGVESGASAQLMRYNKGSSVEEMVSAIRYLSLLGVRLRFGFIFFDPLMSVQDMIENIEFLGRKDILIPAAHDASVEEIFHIVSSRHRQEMQQVDGSPVYEDVSYMVSPLEVLTKSRYLFDLRQQAPQLVSRKVDVSFARYRTAYAVPEIGSICMACQYWVNYCFPIVYALKGLQKISQGEERKLLLQAITGHRYLGYMLIRSLAEIFSLVDDATLARWERMNGSMSGHKERCSVARKLVSAGCIDEAIISMLTWYEEQIQRLMKNVNDHADALTPSKQEAWRRAFGLWMASSLVETRALRMT